MSLFGSLFTGVSGLAAQSQSMSMIADNVANVSTTAYKGAIAQFSSLVTKQAGSATYRPGGVQTSAAYTIANQGLIQGSASPTDVAVAGSGFFVVNTSAADAQGNLHTPTGLSLQGWALDANEQISDVNTLQTVNTRIINGIAAATTNVDVGANLNADETPFTGAYAAGDLASYVSSGGASGVKPAFTREVQVYDSLGRPHGVTMAFLKTGTPNEWVVEMVADPAEVDTGVHADGLLGSGTVLFAGNGSLDTATLTPVSGAGPGLAINWDAAGGADPSTVVFNLGTPGQTDGLTQFSSPTDVAFVNQNGAEVGQLNGVSIDASGYVVASFTNGEQRRLYQLPLATFANPGGLDPRSGNAYGQSDLSGAFNLRVPGTGAAGLLTPSALEAANVDLADEFTKMIVTQRAYSANARVISTTDDMLSELMNIKR
jgi:flagellar hook protein FlgE